MKLEEAILYIDKMKPNVYDDAYKVLCISEVDTLVAQDILNQSEGVEVDTPIEYNRERDREKELLVPVPYTDMYLYYVGAKIDFNNRETAAYSNNMIMFNQLLNEFASYYRRKYMPRYGGNVRGI